MVRAGVKLLKACSMRIVRQDFFDKILFKSIYLITYFIQRLTCWISKYTAYQAGKYKSYQADDLAHGRVVAKRSLQSYGLAASAPASKYLIVDHCRKLLKKFVLLKKSTASVFASA